MADFFSNRIDNYDNVHLNDWAEEYDHIADYFDTSINSLLDIGCGTGLELASIYQKFPNVKITGIDLYFKNFLHKSIPEVPGSPISAIMTSGFLFKHLSASVALYACSTVYPALQKNIFSASFI